MLIKRGFFGSRFVCAVGQQLAASRLSVDFEQIQCLRGS